MTDSSSWSSPGGCVVYVDAGYLLAAAAQRVTGTTLRTSISVDFPALIEGIIAAAETDSQRPLLRLYWYDAARHGTATAEHRGIGLLPRTKIRIGRIGISGEQKGVDLRLGLDLVSNAQRQVAGVAYLVSGDDDLAEAVEDAQAFGPQVILLGVPSDHRLGVASTAENLALAADRILALDEALLERTMTRAAPAAARYTPATAPAMGAPATGSPLPTPIPKPGPDLKPSPALSGTRPPTRGRTGVGRTGVQHDQRRRRRRQCRAGSRASHGDRRSARHRLVHGRQPSPGGGTAGRSPQHSVRRGPGALAGCVHEPGYLRPASADTFRATPPVLGGTRANRRTLMTEQRQSSPGLRPSPTSVRRS